MDGCPRVTRLGSLRIMWDGNSAGCFPGQNKQLPLLPSGSGLNAEQWTALPSQMPLNGLPYSGIMMSNFGNGRSTPDDSSLSAAINLSNCGGASGQIAPPASHHHHIPRQDHILRGESNGSNFPINSTHNFRLPPQQLNFKLGGVHNRANLLTTTNDSSSNQSSSRQPVPSSQLGSSLLAETQLPMSCTQAMPKSLSDNNCLVGAPAAVHNCDKGQGSNTVKNGGSNGSDGSNSNSDEAAPDQLWYKASCGDNGGGSGGSGGSNNNNNSNNINDNGTVKQERPFPSPHLSSSIGGMKRSRARDTDKDSGGDENQDQEEEGHQQGGNKRCSGGRPADRLAYACDSARRRQRASKSVGEMDDDAGDAGDSDVNSSRQEDPSHRHKTQQKRLLWTPELHYCFLNAVFRLGVNNAAPKYIMKLMNVNGLKRENVASHLQKYRQYLKRVAGVSAKDTVSPALLEQAQEVVMREHAFVPSMGGTTMGAPHQTPLDNMAVAQTMNYAAFPGVKPAANIMCGAAVNPLLQQAVVPGVVNPMQQYTMLSQPDQSWILAELQQQIQMHQMQLMQQQAQLEAHVLQQAQRAQQLALQQQQQQQQGGQGGQGMQNPCLPFNPDAMASQQLQMNQLNQLKFMQGVSGGQAGLSMMQACVPTMSGMPALSSDPTPTMTNMQ
eukprot:gene13534-19404_t